MLIGNKVLKNLLNAYLRIFLSVCLSISFIACGGGSAGSGAEVKGLTLSAQTGLALSNIEVRVLETGAGARSDLNGSYQFYSEIPEDGTLTFSFDGVVSQQNINIVATSLNNFSPNSSEIIADWELNTENNSAALIDLQVNLKSPEKKEKLNKININFKFEGNLGSDVDLMNISVFDYINNNRNISVTNLIKKDQTWSAQLNIVPHNDFDFCFLIYGESGNFCTDQLLNIERYLRYLQRYSDSLDFSCSLMASAPVLGQKYKPNKAHCKIIVPKRK